MPKSKEREGRADSGVGVAEVSGENKGLAAVGMVAGSVVGIVNSFLMVAAWSSTRLSNLGWNAPSSRGLLEIVSALTLGTACGGDMKLGSLTICSDCALMRANRSSARERMVESLGDV